MASVRQESPALEGNVMQAVLETIDTLCIQDPIEEFWKRDPMHHGTSFEKYRWLRRQPIRCGIIAYSLKTYFHHTSIRWADTKRSVLACAHLHNALKREWVLASPWKDMELLLKLQDESHLFAGAPPRSAEQYNRRFSLAVAGGSATNFARNRRRPDHIARSTAKTRRLHAQDPVSWAFHPLL